MSSARFSLGEAMTAQRDAEFRRAGRALLMRPLLRARGPDAADYRLVRRHAAELRAWFDRNTGWRLHVDTDVARLFKVPGRADDAGHPARDPRNKLPFTRRRYVLFALTLAVLERSEAQTTLGRLAEQIVLAASDPRLAAAGVGFTMADRGERSDLVAVVRLLMDWGALSRVAGDEDAYLGGGGDALYEVERRVLAVVIASRRGPSTVVADVFTERLAGLNAEPAPEGDDARNRRIRHRLTRRLVDEPVLYYDELDEAEAAYLMRQRAAVTGRIAELTALVPEVRAEGIALLDPDDGLTDLRMPKDDTDGHVTLLLAEHLAERKTAVTRAELLGVVRGFAERYGRYWRRAAREPGAEGELVEQALAKLSALGLVRRVPGGDGGDGEEDVVARPALARFAVGTMQVAEQGAARKPRTRAKGGRA